MPNRAPIKAEPSARVFGLDLLRAYAILSVVYMHAYVLTEGIPLALYELPATDGVAVFFVLSGFLIGRILINTLEFRPICFSVIIQFWVRRWFRTLPTYYLVLSGLVVYSLVHGQILPESLWTYFFFSQNLLSGHPGFFPEAWSLSVEEWFYFLLPMALFVTMKYVSFSSRTAIRWVIVILIVLVTALRVWKAYYFDYQTIEAWDAHLRKQVLTRMDSLMYGVLGAYLSVYCAHFWERIKKPALILGIGMMVFIKFFYLATESMWFLNYLWLSLSSIGALMTLPWLSTFNAKPRLWVQGVTFISLVSYSMYLLNHTVILDILLPKLMQHASRFNNNMGVSLNIANYAIYWCLTLLLSWLLYRFFESRLTLCREPVIRWLQRQGIKNH